MAVVVAHQLFRLRTQRILRLEIEHVLVASGAQMQAMAESEEKVPRGAEFRRKRLAGQLAEPLHEVQIAQATRCFFEIRLEMVDRRVVFGMPRAGEFRQPRREHLGLGAQEQRKLRGEPVENRLQAHQRTLIEKTDRELGVAVVDLAALIHRVHRVAEPHARIPEVAQEKGEIRLGRLRGVGGFDQQKDIDVRVRKQFGAAKAAHRDNRARKPVFERAGVRRSDDGLAGGRPFRQRLHR